MNKTLLQIASFLLIPSLLVADPATAMGFAGGAPSRQVTCSFSSRLDQEAMANVALPYLTERLFGSKVPRGYSQEVHPSLMAEIKPFFTRANLALAGVATVVAVAAAEGAGGVLFAGALFLGAVGIAAALFFFFNYAVVSLLLGKNAETPNPPPPHSPTTTAPFF